MNSLNAYPYTFERQITLYINSDDRDYGTATDFNLTIPNYGQMLPNTPISIAVVQFGSSFGNPQIAGADVTPIQLRTDLPLENVYDSNSKRNTNILFQIPRSVNAGNDFWNQWNYDKTFMSCRSSEFFGRSINFRVTNRAGVTVTGLASVYFVLQIFY